MFAGRSGGPKQKTSVFRIGFAPRPVPSGSRITPPMPVPAPPYGSMADGWLCVSTLKQTLLRSSNRMTPALSLKTETHQGFFSSAVARMIVVLSRLSIRRAVEINDAAERLVDAVLGPGLRERFQLDVGRVAADLGEVVLDRVHLGEVQAQDALLADLEQARVADAEERDLAALEPVFRRDRRVRDGHVAEEHVLDGRVVQHLVADQAKLLRRRFPVEQEFPAGAHGGGAEAHVGDALLRARLDRVHDAGLAEDLDDGEPPFAGRGRRAAALLRRERPLPRGVENENASLTGSHSSRDAIRCSCAAEIAPVIRYTLTARTSLTLVMPRSAMSPSTPRPTGSVNSPRTATSTRHSFSLP